MVPGIEFGNALAGILAGDVSPCARVPTTLWDTVEDYPVSHVEELMTQDKKILYREGIPLDINSLTWSHSALALPLDTAFRTQPFTILLTAQPASRLIPTRAVSRISP